jgi:hypothetical protein
MVAHQQRSPLSKKLRIHRPRQIHLTTDVGERYIMVQHLVTPDLPLEGG